MPAGTQLNYIQYNAFPENYKKKSGEDPLCRRGKAIHLTDICRARKRKCEA